MKRWCWIILAWFAMAAAHAQLREVRNVEGVSEYALPNGLTVLVHEDSSKPTVTAAITYRVGSSHEGAGEAGAAHLLEHMLFRATTSIADPKGDMTRRGVRWNGTTSWDRTNYFGQFAANGATLHWMIGWMADAMVNATISADDLRAEIPVVRNEFERNESSGPTALHFAMLGTAFQWHPYGRPPIGTMSDVEGMTAERLRTFYKRNYRPDNAILVLGGKFDRAAALREVERTFGAIPRASGEMFVSPTREPQQQGEREVVVRRAGGLPAVSILYHIMPATDREFATLRVLVTALAETGGPLEHALVDTHLALRVGGSAPALPAPAWVSFGSALAEGPAPETRARAASQALARELEGSPALDDRAIERARQRILQSTRSVLRDPEQLSLALSEAVALGDWRLLFLSRDWVEAVDPKDVRRLASQWFVASNRVTGLYIGMPDPGPRAPIRSPVDVAGLLKNYQGQQVAASTETKAVDPMDVEAQLVRSRVLVDGTPGLNIVMLPRPAKDDRAIGVLQVHWGTAESLRNQEMLASLAGRLMQRYISSQEGDDVRSALLAMDARLQLGTGASGVSASFEAPAARVPQLLELLGRLLRDPEFSDAAFDKVRAERLAGVRSARSNPSAIASNALSLAITSHYPQGDPRRMQTMDETERFVRAATVAEVRAFWKRFGGARHGELALVGPVDATAVSHAAQAAFGNWSSQEPYEPMRSVSRTVEPLAQQLLVPDKSNAVFLARQPLAITVEDPGYPALSVAVYLLGGQPGSALWQRVREREGLSYSVGASLMAGPGRFGDAGGLALSASFAPQNLQRLHSAIQEELAARIKEGFSQEQVRQAREAILASRINVLAQPSVLNALLAANLRLDRTMEFYSQQTEAIRRLDAEAVNAAMRKYIDPAALLEVAAGSFAAPSSVPEADIRKP